MRHFWKKAFAATEICNKSVQGHVIVHGNLNNGIHFQSTEYEDSLVGKFPLDYISKIETIFQG